ncbi:prenyltransferase [uncultured Sphaerochaeta sp.]|uniref:prenyltransferase n=1 Tax=uncultured Sphaerochaeta sp. TaxID=886478 RepID=UPI002A0A7A80|nr:prenyltransferase [uncultured Sphaerochaeta sp.]
MTTRQFLNIVEMRTKVISMGTFACASLYAVNIQDSVPIVPWVIMGFATLFVDMGTTGFNTFFDYYRGTDNLTYTKEKEKVLVHEQVNPLSALLISLALFALAAVLGLVLASMTSWYLLLVGGMCMLVGFFYTAGPLPISRTPFGELFAGGFLGSVLFLITLFVLGVPLGAKEVAATVPFLLLIGMILSVNNGCDRIGDTANGRKTLSILLGKRGSVGLVATEGLAAYLVSAVFVFVGMYPVYFLPLLVFLAIRFLVQFRRVRREGMDEAHKAQHMGFASSTFISFSLSFVIAFLLSRVFGSPVF